MNPFKSSPGSKLPHLLIVLALCLTALAYTPGLSGIFIFDDTTNILENRRLMDSPTTLAGAARAAFSSDAGLLQRPISMLSLWINARLTGTDPFGFKLTNLAIHLVNGWLVFLLCGRLMAVYRERYAPQLSPNAALGIAAATSALWMLHPLNLTSVLYVVQRMNSLAALFTLAGLLGYVKGRQALCRGENGTLSILMSPAVFGTLAVLSKENGALLPLYMLAIEVSLFQFSAHNAQVARRIRIAWVSAMVLMSVLLIGYIAYNYQGILSTFRQRGFSLTDRLLSETRILWLYLRWALIPDPNQLGIFHDDIAVSRGLLDPISSLIASLAWLLIGTAAIALRRRAPLFSFAVIWYVLGHGMESTFIPLELVFEHRNYLPLMGPILAFCYVLLAPRRGEFLTARRTAFAAMMAGFMGITALRANDWGDLNFAIVEARHHPESGRAALNLGELLGEISVRYPDLRDKYYGASRAQLLRSTKFDQAAVLGQFSLIVLDASNNRPLDQTEFEELLRRLSTNGVNYPLLTPFSKLIMWLEDGLVHLSENQVLALFTAAIGNPAVSNYLKAELFLKLSEYYASVQKNYQAAVTTAIAAVNTFPSEASFHLNLVNFATQFGNLELAEQELASARALNSGFQYSVEIEILEEQLKQKRANSLLTPSAPTEKQSTSGSSIR